MEEAIHLIDVPVYSANRNVLTNAELKIPGLKMLGKHTMTTAVSPLPNHYHKNCFEITYVSDGVITFHVGEKDYKLRGGDVFITFPDEVHSTNLTPMSVGEIYWFQLDITNPKNILFLNKTASNTLVNHLLHLDHHLLNVNSKEMLLLLKKSFDASFHSKNTLLSASYLTVFLHKLLECNSLPQTKLSMDMESSVNYILTHLKEELPLEQLAKLCNLSTSQYKQKFKAQMGVSPRNFINFQKIEASKLLLEKGMDITDVAMELGFNTSSYFSVVFKRYNTYSPSEYIKKYKSNI